MGVLRCSRKGCDNIMCSRYSVRYGYICNECFEELVGLGGNVDIERFMNSYKTYSSNSYISEEEAWEYYLDREFGIDEEDS